MGLRHLRAATNLDDRLRVSATYDIHSERATAAGREFGTYAATSLDDAIGRSDAVVIAAPTHAHSTIAKNCLLAGLHCLVEKPLAPTEAACQELIDLAAIKNLALQAGHVERFNPAVQSLFAQNIASEDILSIAARRMNPPSNRAIEDDVVVDLMVHDLDVVGALKRSPVVSVTANKLAPEHCQAELTFGDGATASITASRSADIQTRDLEIRTKDGNYFVDYAKRQAAHEQETGIKKRESLEVSNGDPLEQQLSNFAECIRSSEQPRVTGTQALASMKLAWRIQAALGNSK